MEDSWKLYDEIYQVARNSELNRRQREHSFYILRKSTTFHPLEVQLCDREFNYESNDRWRDFQFITVCEIIRKQVCICLVAEPIRRIGFPDTPYRTKHLPEAVFQGPNTPYWPIRRIGLPDTPYWPQNDPEVVFFAQNVFPTPRYHRYSVWTYPIRRIDPNFSQYIKKSPQTIWGMLLTTKVDPRS